MKILIIDDEFAALTKMKALLAAYGDCTMTTSADQALRLFESALANKTPFDLVTIDIHLSQASGLDILESLTKMEIVAQAATSIKIMVTASGTKANLVKAYSKGCAGFMVKPVKRDVLEEKMQSLGLEKKAVSIEEIALEAETVEDDSSKTKTSEDAKHSTPEVDES